MMKSTSMADDASHLERLGVVRQLQAHRDGRLLFQLTSKNQAQACGTKVRRFAGVVNVSPVFKYAHLNRNRDSMALAATL